MVVREGMKGATSVCVPSFTAKFREVSLVIFSLHINRNIRGEIGAASDGFGGVGGQFR
jgi:hypothetical protein